jgi:hypothetical protein
MPCQYIVYSPAYCFPQLPLRREGLSGTMSASGATTDRAAAKYWKAVNSYCKKIS